MREFHHPSRPVFATRRVGDDDSLLARRTLLCGVRNRGLQVFKAPETLASLKFPAVHWNHHIRASRRNFRLGLSLYFELRSIGKKWCVWYYSGVAVAKSSSQRAIFCYGKPGKVLRSPLADIGGIPMNDSTFDVENGSERSSGYVAENKRTLHIIDCDAEPFIPEGWVGYKNHKKNGQLVWDPSRITLWLSKSQKEKGEAHGRIIRAELADMPALNANVLDFLLAHQHLIPEEWESIYPLFWGTEYRDLFGKLSVRYLYKDRNYWYWSSEYVDGELNDRRRVVVYNTTSF